MKSEEQIQTRIARLQKEIKKFEDIREFNSIEARQKKREIDVRKALIVALKWVLK